MADLKATSDTGRREHTEKTDGLRKCFQVDKERIILSKAFRRLKHKTQVFWTPSNDHFRTRLSHALEVSLVATTISRNLELNIDLTEAIALGHDLGHAPFGHAGERAMQSILRFEHNIQSERVVSELDDSLNILLGAHFPGYNLCKETINGIRCHPFYWDEDPKTPEGRVVRYADVIAYTNHDYDDFSKKYGISLPNELGTLYGKIGRSYQERINWMINDIINNSRDNNKVSMSDELKSFCEEAALIYKKDVFENHEEWARRELGATNVISGLFRVINEAETKALHEWVKRGLFPQKTLDRIIQEGSRKQVVADYIIGMTDNYALEQYRKLISPEILDYYF